MRIAILGAGKIGESLLAGLRSSDWADTCRHRRGARSARSSCASATGSRRPPRTRRRSAAPTSSCSRSSRRTSRRCSARSGICSTAEQTVLSVAAAITTAPIERHLAADVPVVRSMPNAPVDRARGHRRHVRRRATPAREHLERAGTVLRAVGDVVEVPEYQMDAITAVSGSGPAYYALLAEAMIDGRPPARPLARDLDEARRADDARHRAPPARRGHAPGRAARDGHLAGRDDDARDPRARARGRPRRVPERDQRRDGALERARARR